MLTIIARTISYLFYPLLVILPLPYLLVFRANPDISYALKWSLVSYVFLGVFGLVMLFALWRGIFSDIDVSKRKQRPLLFFLATVIAIIYLVFLLYFNGPPVLLAATAGMLFSILVISYINRKIKASLHMATITACLLSVGIMYDVSFITLLSIPIIGWARVRVKRHTVQETIVGTLCGAFVTAVIYVSIKYILKVTF